MPYPKFSGTDFSKHDVIEFNPDQQQDVGKGFRCGRGEFVSYIKGEKIRNELKSFTSKCLPPADGFRTMYFDLMPLIQQVGKI